MAEQVVTVKRTFTCGKCGRPATLELGRPNRMTFLRCAKCQIEEGTIAESFGDTPLSYFDTTVENVEAEA